MRIKAFQALRPPPELAAEVSCVPYDTVETAEARTLALGNPKSFLHVVRAEIDLPEGADIYSDEAYETAARNLAEFEDKGYLVREPEPCVYVYRQSVGNHSQTGVAACCHVEDFENNLIKRHEKTRSEKEDDRTLLIKRIRAHAGPVFLTYRGRSGIDVIVERVEETEPLFAVTAPDGVEHCVWRVDRRDELANAFGGVNAFYVADGHHRTAAAARAGREFREANPSHTGNEEYNWFLAVLFPAAQLRIRPIHRLVSDLGGKTAREFLDAVGECCRVESCAPAEPSQAGRIGAYVGGQWYEFVRRDEPAGDPVAALDVSFLQDRLLCPVLGVCDPRTDKRIDFVAGSRGTAELIDCVDSGKAAAAFALHPITVGQVMDIADAGLIMPPKSTWFEPKLRSGLFVHTF